LDGSVADEESVVDVADVHLPADFIRAVASAADQESVLRATAEWMPRIIDAERSSVALPIDEDTLAIRSIGGTTPLSGPTRHAIANSMVGRAFRTKKIVVIGDLAVERGYRDTTALAEAGLRSAVVGPLLSGGRCLGTINLANAQHDFFNDAHLLLLLSSVADLVASFLNVHQLAEAEKIRAATDDLTGAMSRRAALDELDRMLADPAGRPAVMFLDLDDFKQVNDSYGHLVGDVVLRTLTNRIDGLLTDQDRLGRLGGDEFVVVVHADPDGERAAAIAESILDACLEPIEIGSMRIVARLSIGMAVPTSDQTDATTLLGYADQAMYEAKAGGPAFVTADEGTRTQVALLATIDRELDDAMASGAIHFNYQPIREIDSGEIKGAEALIRWTHPTHGPIPPPLLIERVEATGRVESFTIWSLDLLARDLAHIREIVPHFHDKALSFNLTPTQLSWSGCAQAHIDTCERFGFRPQDLLVEVVESSAIQPDDAAERTLLELAATGAVIALDDFGVGHNALSYFTRFPIHALKLDRSLIGGMQDNAAARSILKGLTSMAHDLGIVALAEGVETESEEQMCRDAGIDHVQGWLYGRPAPIADFVALAADELGGALDQAA
jgi:diguanylate cyclase (GGDEF)-like protein